MKYYRRKEKKIWTGTVGSRERKEGTLNVTMQERSSGLELNKDDILAEMDLKELSNSRNGPVFH